MKHSLRFALSALLTAAMLAQSAAALSYTAIGEVTQITRDTIGSGLTYTEYGSASQQTYIFEYDPAGGALPLVRWGSTVYGKDRLGSLTSAAKGDNTVLGAINGDFFSMQTGVPLGVMIDNGKLISTDDSKYALGFKADGTAIIGKPGVKLTMTNVTRAGAAIEIDQLNKFPTQWGTYLLTDHFSSTTLSAAESLEIIIRLDGDIAPSGSVTGTVVDVVNGDCNTAIPKGCAVLTVANSYEDYPLFSGVAAGDKLRFDTTCTEGWESVVTAVGGGDLILDGGVMPAGIIDEDHEKVSNPRTAVGIKADGKVVFFAVDGRSTTSRGLTETELSALMAELGCVTALNLDGGGSTTVMVKRSDSTDCVYVNVPADGSYRSVANGILFVSKTKSNGITTAISPVPNTPTVLKGSSVSISALPLDSAYMPAGELIPTDKVKLNFAADTAYGDTAGTIKGGTFTAGSVPGEYRLNASIRSGLLDIASDLSIIVTDKLDSLNVTPTVTKVAPGTLVELDINASYRGSSVIATHESFYYTLNGTHVEANQKDYPGAALLCDIGYLDLNGNFQTFGNCEGEVEIGIHYGDLSDTVIIKSGTGSDIVSDFDEGTEIGNFIVSSAGGNLYLAPTSFGYKSVGSMEIGIRYDGVLNGRVMDVQLRRPYALPEIAESVKLWISGDISGSTLTATVVDEHGTPYTLSYSVTKDYAQQLGWRELTAPIPASLRTGSLQLTSLLTMTATGSAERTYAIDDITIYYGTDAAPALTGLEGNMAEKQIHTLYDMGVIQNFDCETVDGKLWWDPNKEVTREEFAKIMSLWMGYNALAYMNDGIIPEADTAYDKVPYIRAVIANGLMSGYGLDENGITQFNSKAPITREAVFKVLGSLLDTAEVRLLTFTDTADISEWAVTGIAKCVNAGVVNGYDDNTIRPGAPITRAQLAMLLSRMP